MRPLHHILLFLIIFAPLCASAQDVDALLSDGQISIRAFTEPDGQVWFTQQTRLVVELRTSTWFTDAPRYPEIQLSGAVAILPGGFATNYTEREAGRTYAVQRRIYLIYPQRAGMLTIPPIAVRFATSVDGQSSGMLTLQTGPIDLDVLMPQQANGLSQLVTTPRLRVAETYSQDFDELQVGDAITRTITITAEDTLALMLPDLEFAAPAGAIAYAAQPVLNDSSNRGQFNGERVEAATFVFEQAGDFRLPEIEIHWWNPDSEQLTTETLAAVEFSVSAGAVAAATDEPEVIETAPRLGSGVLAALDWLKRNAILVTLLFALVYLLGVIVSCYLPAFLEERRRRRERYQISEEYCFKRLLQVLGGSDDDVIRRRLWAWIDCLPDINTVAELVAASDTPAIAEAWRDIDVARYGSGGQRSASNQRVSRQDLKSVRACLFRGDSWPVNSCHENLNPRAT